MAKAKTKKAPSKGRAVRRAKASITKKAAKARTKPPLKGADASNVKAKDVSRGKKSAIRSVSSEGVEPVQPVAGAGPVRELPVLLPGHRGTADNVGAVPEESAGAEVGGSGRPRHPTPGSVVAGDPSQILVRGLPEDEVVAQEQPAMNGSPTTIRKPKKIPGVEVHARINTKPPKLSGKHKTPPMSQVSRLIISENGDQHPISYRGGYKYQTAEDFTISTGICPDSTISNGFLHMNVAGVLTIRSGYAWDGPSGAMPTLSIMRGALVHDALYQLMRAKKLHSHRRERVDNLFRDICLADGMWKVRAWWVHRAVRRLAGFAADPVNAKEVRVAP